MKIINTVKEMQAVLLEERKNGKSIGFVPTMGFLHEGHLSLIEQARVENDLVVLSIFVNPLQFGPNEDFDAYPRDIERDEQLAIQAGVDLLFYPTIEEMYPQEMSVKMLVVQRTQVLCGKTREGHFDGVVTILAKLFHIMMPNRAYFGLKDAQQVAVVQALVDDYYFPIELVPVPTKREEDGLAKSSRNVYLTKQERNNAPELYKSLLYAEALLDNGERNTEQIQLKIREYLKEKLIGELDYIEIYSYPDLKKMDILKGKIVIAIAVKYSKARLIDNIILTINEDYTTEGK